MTLLANPSILDGLGILLAAVGGAGLVGLFISEPLRPAIKRVVGSTCAVMAVGGALLMVQAASLRDADRNLDAAQQAELAKAVSRFPDVRFEVFAARNDPETLSLASKVVDAVKTGTGAALTLEARPGEQKGVSLMLRDRQSELGRAVGATIGRAFMAARVASITDDKPGLDDRTVWIIVGEKP